MGFPLIADIIVSAVVSKAASKVITSVAKGIGLSDSAAGLLGGIAGIAAGAYSYGAASDVMSAADATSQAGQLAAQTAEFGEAGQALTAESLTAAGGQSSALSGNKALMEGYTNLAPKALNGTLGAQKSMLNQSIASGQPAVGKGAITSETITQGAIEKGATVEQPWYAKMWDDDTKARTLGGFVEGATGAKLQADAADSAYKRQRQDDIDDRERRRWTTPINVKGLTTYRTQGALMQPGAGL